MLSFAIASRRSRRRWSRDACFAPGLRHALPTARDAPSGLWQTDRWPRPPVRHMGSVDAFLSTLEGANTGDVLTIDNEGRRDEACIGDLIALEAAAAGLAGIVVWGLVRDTAELVCNRPTGSTARPMPRRSEGLRTRAVSSEANAQLGLVSCRPLTWSSPTMMA